MIDMSAKRILRSGSARTGRSTPHLRRAVLAALALPSALLLGVVPAAAVARDGGRPVLGDCGAGELCLWENPDFTGKRLTFELANTAIESCIVLPAGFTGDAYANRTGRPVTLYQSRECGTTGEFHTHPSGSWTPRSAYQARAFKIWEH
ncbi:hypothetical protein N566_16315 [Streptomycetaceae bacterium MP113-05]|nr:hypothetical protein N566_16315 [Streptomycetaceae bacterium MP113-05]